MEKVTIEFLPHSIIKEIILNPSKYVPGIVIILIDGKKFFTTGAITTDANGITGKFDITV